MTLKITSVAEPGVLDKERIVMRAEADCDIGRYTIFHARKSEEGNVLSGPVNAYWLADKKIKEGDLVILYSKNGTRSEKKNDGGNTSFFYYWHRDAPLWDAKHKPVLVSTLSWVSASVDI